MGCGFWFLVCRFDTSFGCLIGWAVGWGLWFLVFVGLLVWCLSAVFVVVVVRFVVPRCVV